MTDAHGVARDQLRAFIERIERLEEEKKTIADDIKDVYGEAKSMGYDTKIMKMVIALRKKDEHERTEQEFILDTYLAALGMIPEPFEQDDEPVAAAPTRSQAKPLQAPRTATTVSARVAINQSEVADEMQHPGSHYVGNPEPALVVANRPIGDDGMVRMARTEASAVTAGETATSCEYCDGTGDVHRIDGEWLGYCHCEDGQRLKAAPANPVIPASHGEAEAPSAESVSPQAEATTGSIDANTGGDHVTASENAQPDQDGPGLVSTPRPSKHLILLLRPHCQHPGEEVCGGSGKNHCQKGLAAMREMEVA